MSHYMDAWIADWMDYEMNRCGNQKWYFPVIMHMSERSMITRIACRLRTSC